MKTYLPTYKKCFCCGEHNICGLRAHFYIVHNKVCAETLIDEKHCGFKGVAHGGVLATLLDEALGWSTTIITKKMTVTGELNLRYLRSVSPGEKIKVITVMKEQNRKYCIAEGEIINSKGEVCVKGSGKFFPVPDIMQKNVEEYLDYSRGEKKIFDYLD